MKDYRIVFEKTGVMRYISHLDLNRCMIRAVRRSGLPAWYTEGFHPHLYLMFPLALSLGAESLCEVMDLRLTQEVPETDILTRLNAALPEGLRAVSVGEPQHEAQDITGARYEVILQGEALSDLWEAFLSQEQILVEKKTKKGRKEVDIAPLITAESDREEGDGLHLTLCLPAGNAGNINVSVVVDAFEKYAGRPIFTQCVRRIKIFCEDGKDFL
ncbi:MAG: DUF2344 domain-containing protein [Oscillospiraceae bacterium]|nr:DUF2344 domain-containing protein [Oscillospiraceae bacterium]